MTALGGSRSNALHMRLASKAKLLLRQSAEKQSSVSHPSTSNAKERLSSVAPNRFGARIQTRGRVGLRGTLVRKSGDKKMNRQLSNRPKWALHKECNVN